MSTVEFGHVESMSDAKIKELDKSELDKLHAILSRKWKSMDSWELVLEVEW